MEIGDIVHVPALIQEVGTWRPDDVQPNAPKLMRGRVVYIHPKGRYFTVEFEFGQNKLLESFAFQHTEEENKYENDRRYERKGGRGKNRHRSKYGGNPGLATWQAGVGN